MQNRVQTLSLNGSFTMTCSKLQEPLEVTVPTDNYTALLDAGIIPNPYDGQNEAAVASFGRANFSFSRTFFLPAEWLEKRRLVLRCKALDTLCTLYCNGQKIGEGQNAHLEYRFDLLPYVHVGENTLRIDFFSPVEYAETKQKEKPLPKNNNGTDGIAYLRKPACHFGWDWGPHLPLCGITDDIEILAYDVRVEDIHIRQFHENGKVRLQVTPILDGEAPVELTLHCPDGTSLAFAESGELILENPQLWWTRELSQTDTQPLYTVSATCGGDTLQKRIGLRTIRLDRQPDQYGGNFCFYLNDVPIFAKGASWILPDALMGRVTADTYKQYIDDALSANFNMLRVWGGAYYAPDVFYDYCDERGLLIWQDFMFACLMYPFYESDFLENVLAETAYQMQRFGHHASLALLAGNNEIETMFSYMPKNLPIVQWYKTFFYEILKEQVEKLLPDTPYIPTSPIGAAFRKGVTGDAFGDTHMWNVWHGQKPLHYYRKRMTRFCSEFGLESLPSLDAIQTFAKPEDLGLTTSVFLSHQKCMGGNLKMLYYLFEKFHEPQNFEDFPYFTGLIQKECIADATEHWRRNRHRCHGSLFWQYNDCWPAPSWSSVDYLGKWKPLQYHARHFFAPLTVSICETGRNFQIFAINDLKEAQTVTVSFTLLNFDGQVRAEKAEERTLPPCESVFVCSDTVKGNLQNVVLVARLLKDGKILAEKTKIFVPDKDLQLQPPTLKKRLEQTENGLLLHLKANTFCRSVMVDIRGETAPFSDNYFDLLPNTEKSITLHTQKTYTEKDIHVQSLYDIPVQKNSLSEKLFRLKFALQPLNIGNWFWYSVN